jgi:hypothetical protein
MVISNALHVKLIGEQGSDWGGVSRDAFTTFWNESSSVFFHGDSVHVPYLSLVNMERENQYLILGRIISWMSLTWSSDNNEKPSTAALISRLSLASR